MRCFLCPNDCGTDRERVLGKCRSGREMRIARIAPHYYEEPIISGEKGSGTVFFCGCGLRCSFCQNYEISRGDCGKIFSPEELAREFRRLEELGVHNINLVTPTHYSDRIIETLEIYRPKIPIVYNTSGYEKPEIIDKMSNYVDIFLTDFKYSDNEIGRKYSNVANYFDFCLASTEKMVENKPLKYENGMLTSGVIVRHLILPGEMQNTEKIIEIFAEKWKGRAIFSLMSQFFPTSESPIKRRLKPVEYKIAVKTALKCGLDDFFIQDLSSSDEKYVPDFDLK